MDRMVHGGERHTSASVHHFADIEAIEPDKGSELQHMAPVLKFVQVILAC